MNSFCTEAHAEEMKTFKFIKEMRGRYYGE